MTSVASGPSITIAHVRGRKSIARNSNELIRKDVGNESSLGYPISIDLYR